jgi:hypothetical protein
MQLFVMCSRSECKERDEHKLKKCFFFIVGQTDEQTVRKKGRQTDEQTVRKTDRGKRSIFL